MPEDVLENNSLENRKFWSTHGCNKPIGLETAMCAERCMNEHMVDVVKYMTLFHSFEFAYSVDADENYISNTSSSTSTNGALVFDTSPHVTFYYFGLET